MAGRKCLHNRLTQADSSETCDVSEMTLFVRFMDRCECEGGGMVCLRYSPKSVVIDSVNASMEVLQKL